MEKDQAEKIIALLSEMRDLQKQSVENYQLALKNQEESINIQKNAAGRVRKIVFPILLIVVVLALIAVALVLRILVRYR